MDLTASSHLNRKVTQLVVKGICQGFKIGFDYQKPLRPRKANMISVLEHAGVVSDYLSEELRLGHIEVIGSVR